MIQDLPPPPPAYECVQEAADSVLQLTVSGEPEQVTAFLDGASQDDHGWRVIADATSNDVRFVRLHNAGNSSYRAVGETIYSAQQRRLSVALNTEPPVCSAEGESVSGWNIEVQIDSPDPQQVIARLERCGIESAAVRIEYADELQSDIILIGPSVDPLSETAMECIRRAVPAWYVDVQFENEQANTVYHRYVFDWSERESRAAGERWLEMRGLLHALPAYRPNEQSLGAYARELEGFCSITPGTALELAGTSLLTLRQSYLNLPSPPNFECLFNALNASNIEDHGVSFGFLGNEAVEPSGER